MAWIVQNYCVNAFENVLDKDEFPLACVGALQHLAKYLIWFFSAHQSYNNVRTLVTSDSIEMFQDNVLPESL